MSHKAIRSTTRDKQEADFRRMQETPGDFAAAWPALSRSTPQERERHVSKRAGDRGAFGAELPHRAGYRALSKSSRRIAPFRASVTDRRERS